MSVSDEKPFDTADEKPFDTANNDDQELMAFGYKPSFKREFTNLATVSLPYSQSLQISIDNDGLLS